MFYYLKLYFRDPWVAIPLVGSVVLQALNWWYILTRIHPQTEQIFLHYNIIFGVDLIGNWWKIFYLPGFGTLILFINYTMSFWSYGRDKVLAHVLSVSTFIFEVFLAVAVVMIVGLNI